MTDTISGGAIYLLVLHLECTATITVGAKGVYQFPAGFYVYVGSARRNPLHRVTRHLRGTGQIRWHVDYLRRVAQPVGALLLGATEYSECELAAVVSRLPGASIPCKGFGASDCTCRTHLYHFDQLDIGNMPHLTQGKWLPA